MTPTALPRRRCPRIDRPTAHRRGLVGAGQQVAQPVRGPRRRAPRGNDGDRARSSRLPALRRSEGRRGDRGQAGGHSPVGCRVAVRDVRRRSPCGCQVGRPDQGRPTPLRLRGQWHRDPLHERFRPRAAGSTDLQLPQGGHPRQDAAREGRGAPHLAGQGHRDATPGHHSPTSSADRSDQRRRAEPARAALRPEPCADGDRRRQDLRSGDAVLPAAEVWRLRPHPVPRRPQQPGQADDGRVRELPHPRRRPPIYRALQRQPAQPRPDAGVDGPRDLHHPARLQGAPQRRGRRDRRPRVGRLGA